MGKTDRPKEITLPQVNLEYAVFSDDEESDEDYIIELGNNILISTDSNANKNDESDTETIFSDDDDEQDVDTFSDHSDMDLFELDWGDSDYIIEEVTDDTDDEYMSDSDDTDDDSYDSSDESSTDDEDSDSDIESESEVDNSVAFDLDHPPEVFTNFSQSDNDYEQFSDGSG